MFTNIPVFQSCCFCIPLRSGLSLWGFFKMITVSMWISYYCSFLLNNGTISLNLENNTIATKDAMISLVILSAMVAEIVQHAILIVGVYKKLSSYLKIYYYYAIIVLVISIILAIINIGLVMANVNLSTGNLWTSLLIKTASMIINLLVQSYIILLVRSLIIELKHMDYIEI